MIPTLSGHNYVRERETTVKRCVQFQNGTRIQTHPDLWILKAMFLNPSHLSTWQGGPIQNMISVISPLLLMTCVNHYTKSASKAVILWHRLCCRPVNPKKTKRCWFSTQQQIRRSLSLQKLQCQSHFPSLLKFNQTNENNKMGHCPSLNLSRLTTIMHNRSTDILKPNDHSNTI